MSAEYDYEELREWNRVVVEVTTSWQRISEFVADDSDVKLLKTELVRQVADTIVSRWLHPEGDIKTTSITDLKKMYLPALSMPEFLGDFEVDLDKKAYDKIRPCTKALCKAELIEKLQVGREGHYQPTENLLNYCVNCSQILKEIM